MIYSFLGAERKVSLSTLVVFEVNFSRFFIGKKMASDGKDHAFSG